MPSTINKRLINLLKWTKEALAEGDTAKASLYQTEIRQIISKL